MVVAHFFESGQRRRLRLGRSRDSAPLMVSALVALASHRWYIAAIDEKAWAGPRRLGPGVQGSPQRGATGIAYTETVESRVREAQGRVILLERGWIAAQLRPAGDRL